MGRRKKADSPQEVHRALVVSSVSTRCFGSMKMRLQAGEHKGDSHCGFRHGPEVWVGKVSWERVKGDRLHLNIIAYELSPQTGTLEARYNVKMEDDYTEE